MDGMQVAWVGIGFAFVILATTVAQLRWLPESSRFQAALFFLCGFALIGSLRVANVPPDWFNGSKTGFGLGLTFLATAFIGPAKFFRKPLFLGMTLAMLAANVAALMD